MNDIVEVLFLFINNVLPPTSYSLNYLYELYKEAYTPWDWHEKIIKRSNELGMLCFSTPFDETAVDFLEKLKCPI